MIRLPDKPAKRSAETTISLINIVFLMLIFFLVAGQLSPPGDNEVSLADIADGPSTPPPEALFVRQNGTLIYQNAPITAEAFMQDRSDDGAGRPVRLAADRELEATELLDHVRALYAAGAVNVLLVTLRAEPRT